MDVEGIAQAVLTGEPLAPEAARVLAASEVELEEVLYWASRIRRHHFGCWVGACAIVSARTGLCGEDCAFCAQSRRARHRAAIAHPLLSCAEVVAAARRAKEVGALYFGIVISGRGIRDARELDTLCRMARSVREEVGLEVHGSLGLMEAHTASRLKAAGITCLNHNLETSRRFFGQIVTTHSYADRLACAQAIKSAGVRLCCGGLFGMGETWEDRIELALELARLQPDHVPLNFLHRISGTPLEELTPLPVPEILRTIALFRFALPNKTIGVCGGREENLRHAQALIFQAGATDLIIGDYLTTKGRPPGEDLQMIHDLGLQLRAPQKPPPAQTGP